MKNSLVLIAVFLVALGVIVVLLFSRRSRRKKAMISKLAKWIGEPGEGVAVRAPENVSSILPLEPSQAQTAPAPAEPSQAPEIESAPPPFSVSEEEASPEIQETIISSVKVEPSVAVLPPILPSAEAVLPQPGGLSEKTSQAESEKVAEADPGAVDVFSAGPPPAHQEAVVFSDETFEPVSFLPTEEKTEGKRIELYFEDGTKTDVSPDSPYYADLLSFANRLLSIETEASRSLKETSAGAETASQGKETEEKTEGKRIELFFEDGTKADVSPDSPYYADLLSFANRLLSCPRTAAENPK